MMSAANSSIVMAGLMPHAPILVPGLGRGREEVVADSMAAMQTLSQRLLDCQPARLVVISPHSPRRFGAFGIWAGNRLQGNLARFDCPEARVDLPNDMDWIQRLKAEGGNHSLKFWDIREAEMDHGAVVPLCYLVEAGWKGPTLVLGLNYPGEGGLTALGQALAASAGSYSGASAVLASGDMSHRLMEGAPAGFHPQAAQFDQEFVSVLQKGDYHRLAGLDPELTELAAEDVVDSTRVAVAAAGQQNSRHEVLSYQGPFGVGYCVAVLFEKEDSPDPDLAGTKNQNVPTTGQTLPGIARQALADYFSGRPVTPEPTPTGYLGKAAGVFVTIRTSQGQLRGCRGSILPQRPNLVQETRNMALSSAFQDTRFPEIEASELDDLTFEVSVLHPPETVADTSSLDPHRYGIIVRADDGRQGLMLPGVEGLDTVEQQLAATLRKVGMDEDEPVELQRFEVDKFKEKEDPENP